MSYSMVRLKVIDSVTQEICLNEACDGPSYVLDLATSIKKIPPADMYERASCTQWHRHLAYLNLRDIKRLVYLSEILTPFRPMHWRQKSYVMRFMRAVASHPK